MRELVAQTGRLTLHPFKLTDSAFILALTNTPGWHRFIGDRGIRSESEAELYIANSLQASYQENGYGLYRCQLKETAVSVGMCGLVNRADLPLPDIGFGFLPAFEGQGLAYEASLAVLQHAADDLGMTQLLAITKTENERSIRLLQRLNFVTSNIEHSDIEGNALQVFERDLTTSLK